MSKVWTTPHIYSLIPGLLICLSQAYASNKHVVVLSSDGPVVLGGTITMRADLYMRDGSRPSGVFIYSWQDSSPRQHKYKTEATTNTTSFWEISYPAHEYNAGTYRIDVTVKERFLLISLLDFGNNSTEIEVTDFLNGNMTLHQPNRTVVNDCVSSKSDTKIQIDLRKGDYDYIAHKATSISTFWFVDCKFFGQSPNFTFTYNFTEPDKTHVVEALIVASYEPPVTTTTLAPTTVAPPTTTLNPNTSTIMPNISTTKPPITVITPATVVTESNTNPTVAPLANHSFPFVCLNSSIISPDPNKTYGYFTKEIKVKAPISNLTVDGTSWLQPWEMVSRNVSCKGSGPFHKCLFFHRGTYNITGNETCGESDQLESCKFAIVRYFLEPGLYTIVVVLENDVSKQIQPLLITVYSATKKPQLSVIIVPVSCSLAAVILIVFGVAYYIQSRVRFTVEVADFDFGQNNPEMEYKTFRERLRDSFNNTLRPGGDRISGYEPLNKPLLK
ncbi:uncharacterized protein LOC105683477 [Athalia rosae]|uniref:uncharacterized protein LOC105683477 n=1 Tax=Athalia rosae TaxID=37344 RepID=UPI002034887C|nr:uncharacterized protein LOC105683477 [Athalia rosae]